MFNEVRSRQRPDTQSLQAYSGRCFRSDQTTSGTLTWTRNDEHIGSIGYSSDLTNPSSGSVRLHYDHEDTPVEYRIPLTTN